MSSSELERLYSKKLDDLYEQLGRTLITPEYPLISSITRQAATERGRGFISISMDKLKAKICGDWHYCNKRNDYGNFQALAYALAPLVSNVIGVPAATALIVAIILIKIGLDELCSCPKS